MSDFILMTSDQQFRDESMKVWNDYSPGSRCVGHLPTRTPCLASIFIAHHMIACVVVDKKNAKRLIYPKTNQNRQGNAGGIGWFDWLDGDLNKEVEIYINTALARANLSRREATQAKHIDELMHKVDGVEGPALITKRVRVLEGVTVVNFFLVTRALARLLVYHNKNTNDAREIVDYVIAEPRNMVYQSRESISNIEVVVVNDEAEEPHNGSYRFRQEVDDDLLMLRTGVNGKISITARALFYVQRNVPRFTNEMESGVRSWEMRAIKDMNTALDNAHLEAAATRVFAKRISSDFLAERKRFRVDCAVEHKDCWVNRATPGSDPEVHTVLRHTHMV